MRMADNRYEALQTHQLSLMTVLNIFLSAIIILSIIMISFLHQRNGHSSSHSTPSLKFCVSIESHIDTDLLRVQALLELLLLGHLSEGWWHPGHCGSR